jgi:hypothetical protein
MFIRFKLRTITGAVLLSAVASAAAFTILAPASAQSAVKQLVAIACADHLACLSLTNASTGNAIVGVAQNNHGIVGRTNVNTNTNPNPPETAFIANAGVEGIDSSTNPLDLNAGILGTSTHGDGVVGVTTYDSSNNPFGPQGVLGLDDSITVNGNGGVVGVSNHNVGVVGVSNDANNGVGGVFLNDSGEGLAAIGSNGIGEVAIGNNALQAFGFDTTGAAVVIVNGVGGPLIHAFAGFGGQNEVLSLDNTGNLTIAGGLVQHGSPMAVAATSAGTHLVTYTPQQSERTMEDVGEARLIAGQAIVRLDPAFASSIDTRASYLVFLTPQGDNNGLYVAQKTATGFVVREHNGVSSIAFDYRIVAQPYGSISRRLPLYTEMHAQAVAAGEVRRMQRALARAKSFKHYIHQ